MLIVDREDTLRTVLRISPRAVTHELQDSRFTCTRDSLSCQTIKTRKHDLLVLFPVSFRDIVNFDRIVEIKSVKVLQMQQQS